MAEINVSPRVYDFGKFAGSTSNHIVSTAGKKCSDCNIEMETGGTIFNTNQKGKVIICCGVKENACAQKRIMKIGGHNPENESFKAMVELRKKYKPVKSE